MNHILTIRRPTHISFSPQILHGVCKQTLQMARQVDAKVCCIVNRVFKAIKNGLYEIVHRAIGLAVLPAQNPLLFFFDNIKSKYLLGGEEVKFETADHVTLDGMYFKGSGCQKSDRTVIVFNGNGVRYEQYGGDSGLFDISMWQQQGWNVQVFNYRGVGQSKGMATRDGLVSDGEAAVQMIRQNLVPDNKILLHGHSLGGGIASEVAARNPNVNYCNDRSFISLSKQVKVMFGNGIGSIASRLLVYFGWEYASRDNWDKMKGKKFAVYHENDGDIPAGARFYESLRDDDRKIEQNRSWFGNRKNLKWYQSLLLYPMKKIDGYVAHRRKYHYNEETLYFAAINTI